MNNEGDYAPEAVLDIKMSTTGAQQDTGNDQRPSGSTSNTQGSHGASGGGSGGGGSGDGGKKKGGAARAAAAAGSSGGSSASSSRRRDDSVLPRDSSIDAASGGHRTLAFSMPAAAREAIEAQAAISAARAADAAAEMVVSVAESTGMQSPHTYMEWGNLGLLPPGFSNFYMALLELRRGFGDDRIGRVRQQMVEAWLHTELESMQRQHEERVQVAAQEKQQRRTQRKKQKEGAQAAAGAGAGSS